MKKLSSPSHSRDQPPLPLPMSLSTSLSRRRQPSPIFPHGGGGAKKRGNGFENPEPSSPKVTCIGQVRVKSKKKGKQMRSLSRRRSGSEVNARRMMEHRSHHEGSIGEYARASSCSSQHFVGLSTQESCGGRNQRWVHLPLTICEALRAFGAEFSCLLPCGSSCFGGERGKEEEKRGSSCGALFGGWLVTMEREGVKERGREREREIEFVVGEDYEESVEMRSSRRHVLEDFKISDEVFDGKGRVEEEGRVSICIPPKNALLLMRCKSDPMKMAALTKNKFWEPPYTQEEEDEDEEQDESEAYHCKVTIFGDEVMNKFEVDSHKCEAEVNEVVKEIEVDVHKCEGNEDVKEIEVDVQKCEALEEIGNPDSIGVEEVVDLAMEVQEEGGKVVVEEEEDMKQEVEINQIENGDLVQETELVKRGLLEKEEELIFLEALEDQIKKIEEEEDRLDSNEIVKKEEESCRISCASFSSAITQAQDEEEAEAETESTSEKYSIVTTLQQLEHQNEDLGNSHVDEESKDQEMETSGVETEKETENEEVFTRRDHKLVEDNSETVEMVSSLVSSSPKSGSKPSVLPDCLLLMMYEPKLSMEVSKETWVCSTDFSRWLPQRHKHVKQPKIDDTSMANSDEAKKRISTDSRSNLNKKSQSPHQAKHSAVAADPPLAPPTALLPPRSSCSYPVAAVSMAALIEQKLVNAVGYEPFVLKRCKSEPMRTAGKLAAAQEGCFWTKRKLEPLCRAAYQVGTTGVGF